ncbi:uncharacterized protein LOC119673002 [Teleopsis dalmanni]|uniref:uncharacterized protein LOC119673002 n=1 Tax=Teleopsis dalmanni TaxID=139649 RepID=UPI0018CEDC08|nr:uncharacterized protein LOC119673002 [Teleopsis dalmanni]
MTEKDNVSMATVQMKPDYAASEVYSTASEAPPLGFFNFNHQAYKRQSNSVKIAKITAFTIIVSSFVLGFFILASSYLQAKASCDQVQALDSVLEKELMLETLQQVNKVTKVALAANTTTALTTLGIGNIATTLAGGGIAHVYCSRKFLMHSQLLQRQVACLSLSI